MQSSRSRTHRSSLLFSRQSVCALWIGSLLIALVGCASSPAYRPFDGSVGYSEARLAPDRLMVSYNATSGESPGRAMTLAIARAAELAFEAGRSHFRIDSTDTQILTRTESTPPYTVINQDIDRADRDRSYVYTYPGSTTTRSSPLIQLRITLLDSGDPAQHTDALATREVIVQAIASGIQFGPQVSAHFGTPLK